MRGLLFVALARLALHGVAFAHAESAKAIECIGTVTYLPVPDLKEPELRNGRMILEFDADSHQDEDCSTELHGRTLLKVAEVCHPDKLCKITGLMGVHGLRIIKVQDLAKRPNQ